MRNPLRAGQQNAVETAIPPAVFLPFLADERQKALLWEAAERHQWQRRPVAGSVLARPAQGGFEGLLLAQLACHSARASDPRGGGRGSRWGSCRRPGAAAVAARGARQGAQEGAVALGQGQERAGMGRARVGVPPGERRLRAAHVERVGAAAVGCSAHRRSD